MKRTKCFINAEHHLYNIILPQTILFIRNRFLNTIKNQHYFFINTMLPMCNIQHERVKDKSQTKNLLVKYYQIKRSRNVSTNSNYAWSLNLSMRIVWQNFSTCESLHATGLFWRNFWTRWSASYLKSLAGCKSATASDSCCLVSGSQWTGIYIPWRVRCVSRVISKAQLNYKTRQRIARLPGTNW